MQTILVTGGAGFIGSQYVRQTIARSKAKVVVLDRLTYAGNRKNLSSVAESDQLQFVRGDIANRTLVKSLLDQHQCDAVIHFAAETHVDRSIDGPDSFVKTNVLGSFELLEATLSYFTSLPTNQRSTFRFLQVSTDEVYGSLDHEGKFDESTAFAPSSIYSATKAAADHLVHAYHRTHGLPTVTVHSSNAYGPHQYSEKLIPLMIRRATHGESMPVYGDGSNVRDWLHVEDLCDAISLILRNGRTGETYNVGAENEIANLEIVKSIASELDQRRPLETGNHVDKIEFVADRPGHDFRYAIDPTKIKRELGWAPQIPFAEGIASTVQWYLDHPTEAASQEETKRRGLKKSQNDSEPCDEINEPIDGVTIEVKTVHHDERGWLIEIFRSDEQSTGEQSTGEQSTGEQSEDLSPAMSYVSQSLPGVVRGPHEHRDQTDCFAFFGPGDFRIYLWDARKDSATFGNRIVRTVGESLPAKIVIPPGVVHAYKNVSSIPGLVFNSPNRLYAGPGRKDPVDEIRHELDQDSPYVC